MAVFNSMDFPRAGHWRTSVRPDANFWWMRAGMPGWKEQLNIIRSSGFFDPHYYTQTYSDVSLSGLEPEQHFLFVGARLGRRPCADFDPSAYLARYLDVSRRGENPLVHYELWGRGEGRLPAPPPAPTVPTGNRVDIVIPVFNARTDVEACLRSVAATAGGLEVRALVVNDGSDAETTSFLRMICPELSKGSVNFELIEHEGNLGYTKAINSGLRAIDAPYIVMLNSDTVVTERWLEGLVSAVTGGVGLAGPLSNAASWQNVPTLMAENGSGFAINALPEGLTIEDMAVTVRKKASGPAVLSPFLNGFCIIMRREVLDAVGFMDEASFPQGYGEENDFCLRAADAGFDLAIVRDVYVFHAKSRSFGHARRDALSAAGTKALRRKHGDRRFDEALQAVSNLPLMEATRAQISAEMTAQGLVQDTPLLGQKVLFLLPVPGGGGGAHSVVQEATAMVRLGVHVKIAVQDVDYHHFMTIYGDIPEARDLFTGFRPETVVATAQSFDVVVATLNTSVALLDRIAKACPWILPAYYVQDYEPEFAEEGSAAWHEARGSYTAVDGALLFAKTDWLRRRVTSEHGVEVMKVAPSIDHEVYAPPQQRQHDGPIIITAMVRPETPRRGPGRTMNLLAALSSTFGSRVEVHIFGCALDDPDLALLERDFPHIAHGTLKRPEVADLLRKTDVFIDMSDYQAFGRTSLEAMACGALAVVPKDGGGDEYAVDGVNSLVVDTWNVADCHDRISELLKGPPELLAGLRKAGLKTAARYTTESAARSELEIFATALKERRATNPVPLRPRIALIPALNEGSHVSITGSGFVRLLCPYLQDSLAQDWNIAVTPPGQLPEPGSADVAILQRDLFTSLRREVVDWAARWKAHGGRLIYEIDDDLTDIDALRARGYQGDAVDLAARANRYADLADLITVGTPHLATRFPQHAEKIVHVPNFIDGLLWDLAPRPRPANDIPVVGYVGTPTHSEDLALVRDVIVDLEREDHIRAEVIGAFDGAEVLFGTPIGPPPRPAYPHFVSWLQEVAQWDIAIIPLADTLFNRSKSNLKFIECAALNAAVICSETDEYARVVRNNESGILVQNTPDAWRAAILRLVQDATLRRSLAQTAIADVRAHLTLAGNAAIYDQVLRRALGLASTR